MRFPGAAQHEVVRCRPGIDAFWVPDQRRTATLRRSASKTRVNALMALRRIRDTRVAHIT
jgi:hypothetical protein